MLASFYSFTWWQALVQLGLYFAPCIVGAALGVRGGTAGTRGNALVIASMVGMLITVAALCGMLRKETILTLLLPPVAGGLVSFGLARWLAR